MQTIVKEFQQIASGINENTPIEKLEDDLHLLNEIIGELLYNIYEQQNGYYIAVYNEGLDDNFVTFYTLLGKMTKIEALKILQKISKNFDWNDVYTRNCVKSVSRDDYEKWYALAIYSKMLSKNKWVNNRYRLKGVELEPIYKKIFELRKELGLTKPWERVNIYRS